jgi:arylsulfatase A
VKPTYRRYIRDTVDDWSEVGDSVRWKIDVVQPGRYEVTLSYGCRPADAGSRFRVSVGEAAVEGVVEATLQRDVFRPRVVGTLDLPQGPAVLEIKPLSIVGSELMALHKVWLRRLLRCSPAGHSSSGWRQDHFSCRRSRRIENAKARKSENGKEDNE